MKPTPPVQKAEVERNKRMLHKLKVVTHALNNLNTMLNKYNQNVFFNAQTQFNKRPKYFPARQHFPGTRAHAMFAMAHPVTRGNFLLAEK